MGSYFPYGSTHLRRWLYTSSKELATQRASVLTEAIGNVTSVLGADFEVTLTVEESVRLVEYFAAQLLLIVAEKKFDFKVASTAATFFVRFFSRRSVLEYDPRRVLVTCLLLALKVEEMANAVSLKHFCDGLVSSQGGIPLAEVLNYELPILDALSFQLAILHVRTPLQFLTTEYYQSERGGLNGINLEAFNKRVADLNARAEQLSLYTFSSDIPLLFSPAHIAVVCYLHAARELNLNNADKVLDKLLYGDREHRQNLHQQYLKEAVFQQCGLPREVESAETLREKLSKDLEELQGRFALLLQERKTKTDEQRAEEALGIMKKVDRITKAVRKAKTGGKKKRKRD